MRPPRTSPTDVYGQRLGTSIYRRNARWSRESDPSVRAPLVVVRQVDTQQLLEVPASQDEEPIETVVAHGSHPSFGISVRFWRPDRGANNPDALRAKHLVEGLGEFGVAVMNEELELVTLLTKVAGKVA